MAHQGFDSLTIDMQHGVVDYQVAVSMLQGISTPGVIPLARVPWNDPARLMKILDAGAYGVICPMINTAQEAEAMVQACKYPPRGFRSWGPVRASLYAGSDYGDHANDDIIVMPMIETAEALKNLDDILSVDGVDAIYVGPSDLTLALGSSRGSTRRIPRWWTRRRRSWRRCKRHGRDRGHPQCDRGLLDQDDRGGLPVRDPGQRQPAHGREGRRRSRHRPQDRHQVGKLPAY